MEITLLEDPACSWCWAFQPAITTLQFEFLRGFAKRPVKFRRVMGGLSDRPVLEGSFFARHWMSAAELSGMPFNIEIWNRHLLRTTYEACRVVKAAISQGQPAVDRILRRVQEAFHVEVIPIDEREILIELCRSEGLDVEGIRENLANGRADFLFERDRQEASLYRFGFPTLLIRKHPNDVPTVLHGIVPYNEVLQALERTGLPHNERRRFCDRPDDWERLFSIHSRLALAEIRMATGLDGEALADSMLKHGIRQEGAFFVRTCSTRSIPLPPVPVPGGSAIDPI